MPDFFGGMNGKGDGKRKFNWSFIYIAVTLVLIGIYFFSSNDTIREVNDMEFLQMVKNQDIEHVEYVKKNSHVNIFVKKSALEQDSKYEEVKNNVNGPQYYLVVTDLQVYNEDLKDAKAKFVQERVAQDSTLVASEIAEEYDFPMKQDNSQSYGFEIVFWLLPILLIFLLSWLDI